MKQKKVFNTGEIAHLWVHATQSEARNQANNFYFTGGTIFSYGGHFPIASHIDGLEIDGKPVIMFTTNGYSSTTAKHISHVRGAIAYEDFTVLYVPEVPIDHGTCEDGNIYNRTYTGVEFKEIKENISMHENNMQFFINNIIDSLDWYKRARKDNKVNHLDKANNELLCLKQYIDIFKVVKKHQSKDVKKYLAIETLGDTEAIKEHEALKAQRVELAKREKERQLDLLKDNEEKIKEWKAAERYSVPLGLKKVFLRVFDGRIQTSKSVYIPLEDGQNAWKAIQLVIQRGKDWNKNGKSIPVGDYQLDKITKHGDVRAGCHYIEFDEIQELATKLNW